MANRAINVTVVTEVGFCPFCARTRNLRREERHLGGLVRTTIDCESCHRTLSSTIGPPAAKPEPEPEPAPVAEPEPAPEAAAPARPVKRTTKPRSATTAARKPATRKTATTRTKKPSS